MAEKIPVVIEANWDTYFTPTDDGVIYVTFYAGANELPQEEYPFCARVLLPIKQPNENGGPEDEEADRLYALEDELTALLQKAGIKCVQVGRLTHDGTREIVFQVADWEAFRGPVGYWLGNVKDYEIDVSEHEGWEFFEQCVWPSEEHWLQIRDRSVVDGLIESGSNPEKEHSLDYAFRGSREGLQTLRTQLLERGYVDSSFEDEQLVMIKKLPLDLMAIWSESIDNNNACNELGLELEGWGACIEE